MGIPRRFVFRGNASAFGGYVYRPTHEVFEVNGASSLDVVGGRSVAEIPEHKWRFARFAAARTFAEGLFEEFRDAPPEARVETWNPRQEELTPVTSVWSELVDLTVGETIPFSIKRLRAHLSSRSTSLSPETAVAIDPKQTVLEGVSVNGVPLRVDLDCRPFVDHVTVPQIYQALQDDAFVKEHGHCFFLDRAGFSAGWPRLRRLFAAKTIYATIVKSIGWVDEKIPGVTFEGNSMYIPNFGRVYFGELLIDPNERRFTMVRFDWGSPDGGKASGGGVQSNGTWVP